MSLFPLLSHMKEKKKTTITDNSANTRDHKVLTQFRKVSSDKNNLRAEEISKPGNFYVHISSHN